MMRGVETGSTSRRYVAWRGDGLGYSTAATCVVLGELPSLNLSSITFSPASEVLGIHEIMWAQ